MKMLEVKSSDYSPFDCDMMDVALRMAQRGLGITAPNPSVGAVIANEKTQEVIARGWTQRGGRPHAETVALAVAGEQAAVGTLYVTLEPCAHFGVTPPCVEAIKAARLKRVVVALIDPDPRTGGAGIVELRKANIEVSLGLRQREAQWITIGHILRLTQRRPLVSLKIATDTNGFVPCSKDSQPQFVTGLHARSVGHRLRCQADAILVGAGTLFGDNPELTCRLPGLLSRSPLRIILTGSRKIPLDCKITQSAKKVPVLLVHSNSNIDQAQELIELGAEFLKTETGPQGVSIPALLECLAARGITRLLVEGGPKVWHAFSKAQMVDEIFHFHASSTLTEQKSKDILQAYLPYFNYELSDCRQIGDDTLIHWRRSWPTD